jgi:hypothetical protein
MTAAMRNFLLRLTSRKFIATMSVITACAFAVFAPEKTETGGTIVIRIAALVIMLLAALGYALVEASVDKSQKKERGDEDR